MFHVLHVSSVGMNARGGTEQAIQLLCRHLRTRDVASFLWSPYGGGTTLDELNSEGVLDGHTFTLDAEELSAFIARNRIDCALLHSGALNPLYALAPARVLSEIRELPLVEVMHRATPSWAAPYRVDRIVTVSRHVASLQDPRHLDRVCTIYNGLEPDFFTAPQRNKAQIRETFGLPQSGLVAGFLGRLAEEKGPQDFIEVAASVSRSAANAHFVLGGDGPLLDFLRQRAAALHLSNIRFLGHLPAGQRTAFYAALDLLVLPTRTESFSFVAVEAMAAALPVVAYRTGALPEILGNSETHTVLVNPYDVQALSATVMHLLSDEDVRSRIACGNRRAAEHFTIERTADAYRSLFDTMVRPRERQRASPATPIMHRYCGNMALLLNDRSRAESCFRKTVALDPRMADEIRADIARFVEFAQRLQQSA